MSTRNSLLPTRNIALESLESRLNLSTLNAAIPLPASTTGRSALSRTFTTSRQAAKLTPTVPGSSLSFGATSISNTTATSIDITTPSTLSGAQIEYVNGRPDIGYMSTSGADIEYTLNVAAAGTYNLNFGVSSLRWGTFDLSVNGTTQAQYGWNATGAWQTYATTTSQTITLAAGTNIIKISPTWQSQFNINAISLAPVSVSTTTTPAASTTVSIPNYSAISNSQLEYMNGNPDIGYDSSSGAYVEYTLNVATAGNYNLTLGAAETSAAQVALSVNGTQSATYSLASTGAWSTFANSTQSIYLPAGAVTLRFSTLNGSQYNLGALSLAPNTTTTSSSSNTTTTSVPIPNYSAISNSQLEYINGNPDIGYASPSGAYVEYTLNVAAAGNYNLTLGTAETSAAQVALSVNGAQSATYSLASTGAWSTFANSTQSIYLPAGAVTLRFSTLNGTQYNLGALSLAPATTTTSSSSNTTSTSNTTLSTGIFDATVSTQWISSFNQLNIVAGSSNDSIYVAQSGSTIFVTVNGVTNSYTGSYGDIVVKAGAGSDSITIASSVTEDALLYGGTGADTLKNLTQGDATIVSIGGGTDTVQGNGSNTAYWVDSYDNVSASATETNAGDVHKVSAFYNGVSTTLAGQTFTEPAGTGATTTLSNVSLWGTGPTMSDVNQGQVSDCYLLASLQTMANTEPSTLRQFAVDLGDGTYAVQFQRNGVTTYVRVDGQLPSNGYYANGLMYAHPGSSGDIWVSIIEKAYAEFHTGAYSYASLNWGYFGSVLSDFGIGYTAFSAGNTSSLFSTISTAISNGKGVTIGTNTSITASAPLIASHTYTITAAWTDSSGTQFVTLRNPWGYDGAGNDSNTSDALVTMTISQLNQNLAAGAVLT